jgi:REP element-mobilizing transposase RayT
MAKRMRKRKCPSCGVFFTPDHRNQILQEAIELFALRVSAFCLMPNHYHLLVQTPDVNWVQIF